MGPQLKLPAVFMRGGTSKGIFFHRRDLPADMAAWDALFLAAIGSPDPHGRQLDGMGGGISSLSKVVVIGPPSHPEADVDYTFGQVEVAAPRVDYRSNCGNLSSAVGPFAVDEGLVSAAGDVALVRIHNTNTRKLIHARFPLVQGRAAVEGELELDGVAGTGAAVRLAFQEPGGANTGRLLPTGRVCETLQVAGLGRLEASLVDASVAVVFVRAADLGLKGVELPDALEADPALLERLEAIRGAAAVAMGLAATPAEARQHARSAPKVALVARPADAPLLSGAVLPGAAADLNVRMISMGRPHRAVPLTGALCTAVAARIPGTLVHAAARPPQHAGADLRLGHPSGLVPLAATVAQSGTDWLAREVVVYRTARRLMEGAVLVPASRVPAAHAAAQRAGTGGMP
ncbi:MAG: PrpF family protein [Candidatus Lambdaproteobacteria bacterium]|nr:PrpF family protein [Candidatus Lambdaproteobacteria bacterium]